MLVNVHIKYRTRVSRVKLIHFYKPTCCIRCSAEPTISFDWSIGYFSNIWRRIFRTSLSRSWDATRRVSLRLSLSMIDEVELSFANTWEENWNQNHWYYSIHLSFHLKLFSLVKNNVLPFLVSQGLLSAALTLESTLPFLPVQPRVTRLIHQN